MPLSLPWLNRYRPDFPPVDQALAEPSGLLAAGGSLAPEFLLNAYRRGIFPWFSEGDPILWWSPDPRMVLFPEEVRISHSLRKSLRRGLAQVRCDSAFGPVIAACAGPREGADGTWITPGMQAAYLHLHRMGWAHSVETWIDGELVGGLYGLAIGQVFYGESMFAHATDASKIAFAHLARDLERRGFRVIDCQMKTAHLASLGARTISRGEFSDLLAAGTADGAAPGAWSCERMQDIDWENATR